MALTLTVCTWLDPVPPLARANDLTPPSQVSRVQEHAAGLFAAETLTALKPFLDIEEVARATALSAALEVELP